jgi:SAM-dependent methyltransferase
MGRVNVAKKKALDLDFKKGILLDIGCGDHKRQNFVGMDKRPTEDADIVHDIEVFPWPLPDECCHSIVGSQIVEHIKPWLIMDFFNEMWRVMKPDGQLALAMPFAGSRAYWQDPTHCTGFTETTFGYFDPTHITRLYTIYRPKPWKIEPGFPVYQMDSYLECILRKMSEKEGAKCLEKLLK